MIFIIGIGDDGIEGLSPNAIEKLNQSELIVAPSLLAKTASAFGKPVIPVGGDLEELATFLDKKSDESIVVLTSGDPLFYGTARFLCDRLGKDRFTVIPHVSSMQLAFARVKENWDEAYLTNLAAQPIERVLDRIRISERIGLFTSEQVSPSKLAQLLVDRGYDYFTVYVCENLGSPDERVTRGTPLEIAQQRFSPLNVMVLVRQPGVPDKPVDTIYRRPFGNPDDLFLQSKPKRGLLTPSEIRSIALSELEIQPETIMWDVGAGSGSVAIEASGFAYSGHVYAIEMDVEDYQLLVTNTQRFGIRNLTPVHGQAPAAWNSLPDPDAVFVGGTGRAVTDLVQSAWSRLAPGGRMVASVSGLDAVVSLQTMIARELDTEATVLMIQLSRGNYQFDRLILEAANPTFLVKVSKAK